MRGFRVPPARPSRRRRYRSTSVHRCQAQSGPSSTASGTAGRQGASAWTRSPGRPPCGNTKGYSSTDLAMPRRFWVPARTLANPIARSVLEYPFVFRAGIDVPLYSRTASTSSSVSNACSRGMLVPTPAALRRCTWALMAARKSHGARPSFPASRTPVAHTQLDAGPLT